KCQIWTHAAQQSPCNCNTAISGCAIFAAEPRSRLPAMALFEGARAGRRRTAKLHHQRRHDPPATRPIEERSLLEFRRARDFDKNQGGTATGSEEHRRNVLTVFASAAMMAPRGGCSAA